MSIFLRSFCDDNYTDHYLYESDNQNELNSVQIEGIYSQFEKNFSEYSLKLEVSERRLPQHNLTEYDIIQNKMLEIYKKFTKFNFIESINLDQNDDELTKMIKIYNQLVNVRNKSNRDCLRHNVSLKINRGTVKLKLSEIFKSVDGYSETSFNNYYTDKTIRTVKNEMGFGEKLITLETMNQIKYLTKVKVISDELCCQHGLRQSNNYIDNISECFNRLIIENYSIKEYLNMLHELTRSNH